MAQVTDRETRITEGRKACKRMKDEVARMTKEIDIITKKIEKVNPSAPHWIIRKANMW